jgi:hypothetical protein
LELVKPDNRSGALARGLRLGKLGFGLVGSYLGYQAQNLLLGETNREERKSRFQRQASSRVRRELGALKGPAMKLGQMLSLHNGMFSEDALRELAGLQMQAPGMHASLARAQFKSSLGKYPEDLFKVFEPAPFAAASLGQVHRAVTFDGEAVAVKIQYPAIRSAIENDFKLLRSATIPTRITGHVSSALLAEIERGILEETDYLREAANQDLFRGGLSGLDYVTVPCVRRELSTDRVLTMSFVEGETLAGWLGRKPSQALRDLVAFRLVEMFETQLRCLKTLHADQHPGNYLFRPDGGIGLIDFGCVKTLPIDILELRQWYDERRWRESAASEREFLTMVYGPHISLARARKLLPLLERVMDVLRPQGPDSDIIIDYREDAKRNAKLKELQRQYIAQLLRDKLVNPEVVFIFRADMGLHHLLRELRARVNFTEVWRRVSDSSAVTAAQSKSA